MDIYTLLLCAVIFAWFVRLEIKVRALNDKVSVQLSDMRACLTQIASNIDVLVANQQAAKNARADNG